MKTILTAKIIENVRKKVTKFSEQSVNNALTEPE